MTNVVRPIRTRFAPSPTGFVHIGSMRTVLFEWLLARQSGGQFILRVEDTDQNRYVEGAEDQLKASLQMMDFQWDEGPDVGGPFAPYRQSERLQLYAPIIAEMEERGILYRCFCSRERLDAVNAEKQARKQAPGYDRHCRGLDRAEAQRRAAAGEPHVYRLALRLTGEVVTHDALRGPIVFQNETFSDPVMIKGDGFPTYHFAAPVDDHLMEITHVLRGEEWIATSPYHVTLYELMGWEQPVWVHLPQVLGSDGKKLSKRHGATGVNEFIEQGYLVDALTNCLALVGWGYDETTEIMTRQELIERFSIAHISPNGGSFSHDKLNWFNGQYIRKLTPAALGELLLPYLQATNLLATPASDAERSRLAEFVPLIQERLVTLGEAPELLRFFFQAPTAYGPELLPKKYTAAATKHLLEEAHTALSNDQDWTEPAIEATLRGLAEEIGAKPGDLFMAIRVAATGSKASPPLFHTLHTLGKAPTLERLACAASTLHAPDEAAH